MKIVPFPRPGDERDGDPAAAQIEAALHGQHGGEAADYWRELRADVRSVAPAISPEFERELRERIEQRAAAPKQPHVRTGVRGSLARVRAWLGSGMRPRLLAVGGACAAAVVLVVVLAAPWRSTEYGSASSSSARNVQDAATERSPVKAQAQKYDSSGASAASSVTAKPETAKVEPTKVATPLGAEQSTSESSSTRVQQRAATLTLAPKPAEVQPVADRIAQLVARDGGFVQSSQVRLQRGSGGEANLQLSLPSTRLSAALAELARLAPTRAQSQSLQDITDEYGAARSKLSDAVAARQALLRALAKAGTQGEIESLRARLSLAAGAVSRARVAFAAVARRGGNSSVEVNVLGDAHAASDRSTLATALHDAGDVLKVALAVLIVALAVLVPLALLAALGALTWRASRRRLRERALS
jgi:cytoskeletal protein RodZ